MFSGLCLLQHIEPIAGSNQHNSIDLPASTRSFSTLENANNIKGPFLSKGINGNGSRWSGANDGYSPYRNTAHSLTAIPQFKIYKLEEAQGISHTGRCKKEL